MISGLTEQQARVVEAIRRLTVDGVAPSYSELCADLDIPSKGNLQQILARLRERGVVEWMHGRARSLRLVGNRDLAIDALRGLGAEDLRFVIARAAGLAAHADRDGGAETSKALHSIADRLTGQPRRRAA
jgi:SOS-response transcriptional repressor LexA